MREHDRGAGGRDRAVSEVLGYILIFGLILISITAVSVGGIDSLESVRDAEQLNNAERAFQVLADNIADIYERGAPSRATEFSIGAAELFTGENTTIEIFDAPGSTSKEFTVTPLVFRSGDGNEIVYEAGGIFRTRRDAGRVVRDPPQKWSASEPIVVVVGTFARARQSVAGTDVLTRMKTRQRSIAFDRTTTFGDAKIRVESERADLWERYLADEPGIDSCTMLSDTEVRCDVLASSLLVTVHRIEMTLEQ